MVLSSQDSGSESVLRGAAQVQHVRPPTRSPGSAGNHCLDPIVSQSVHVVKLWFGCRLPEDGFTLSFGRELKLQHEKTVVRSKVSRRATVHSTTFRKPAKMPVADEINQFALVFEI